jgi:hypothetical protein
MTDDVEKTPQNSTPAKWTKAGEKLITILVQPENRFKNVSQVCELAGIDRKTYYNLFKNPAFVAYYKKHCAALVTEAQAKVINASIHGAVRGNAQHTKIILSMAGVYQEKTGLVINPDENGNPRPIRVMSDMELAVRIARLLFKSPEVVEAVRAKLTERGFNVIELPASPSVDHPGADSPGVATEPGEES